MKFLQDFSLEYKSSRKSCMDVMNWQQKHLPMIGNTKLKQNFKSQSKQFFETLFDDSLKSMKHFPVMKLGTHRFFQLNSMLGELFASKRLPQVLDQLYSVQEISPSNVKLHSQIKQTHKAPINVLHFINENGKTYLISGGSDGSLFYFSFPYFELHRHCKFLNPIKDILIIQESQIASHLLLLSLSNPVQLVLYNSLMKQTLQTIRDPHESEIMSMQRLDKYHLIATGGFEGNINFWKLDLEHEQPLSLVSSEKGHLKCVKRIVYNTEIGMISGGGDGILTQWALRNTGGSVARKLENDSTHSAVLSLCIISPNTLITGNQNGEIRVWNTKLWRVLKIIRNQPNVSTIAGMEWIHELEFIKQGKFLLAGVQGKLTFTIQIWNIWSTKIIQELKPFKLQKALKYEEHCAAFCCAGVDEIIKQYTFRK